MMKTIFVLLFALTSSNALAQRHVPGGGPVGSPGNPGTGHPGGYNPGHHGGGTHVPGGGPQGPRNYPNYPNHYPNQNHYPNNYPNTNPRPSYPVGPCVINSQYSGNAQYYTVYDGRGYYISAFYDYYQALRTAENYDRMGYCRGIRNNTYPNPNPNPNPNPYPPHTYCMVMTGQDAYGNRFYRVLDSAGRIIFTTQNYSQAVQVSQTDQRCFRYN